MTELAHHQSASSLDYKEWLMHDVLQWLDEHLKLPHYKEVFCKWLQSYGFVKLLITWTFSYLILSLERLGIDGSLLDHITDADLQSDFGINVRLHRVKIIEGIKKL